MSSQQATPPAAFFMNINLEQSSDILEPISHGINQETTLDLLDHSQRARSLLAGRDKETGSLDDLERTITALETTLAEAGERPQPISLGYLGALLYKRFERTGSLADLNRAIDTVCQAIDATPGGHSDQALYLSNLSTCLRTRYERGNPGPDLDRSVEVSSQTTRNDTPSVSGAPEGETIYANTPQHHGTVLLLQMRDKSGTSIEA